MRVFLSNFIKNSETNDRNMLDTCSTSKIRNIIQYSSIHSFIYFIKNK